MVEELFPVLFGCNMAAPLKKKMNKICCQAVSVICQQSTAKTFSTTACLQELRKLARVRVVDNSSLGRAAAVAGKPARIIHVYNKQGVAYLGDKVLLAIKGQKKRAYLVGAKQKQQTGVPRFDSNNVVLVEDNGSPVGTRITVPIPSSLRAKEGDFTKILSLATKFV